MQFTIGDVQLEADVEEGESFTSKHTGKDLHRLVLQFSCQGEQYNGDVLNLFERAKKEGLTCLGADDSTIEWKAATDSWQYSGSQGTRTVYHHTWNIEECEPLNIEKLVIDGIELEPYKYKENFLADALEITARIRQSEEERKAFGDHFRKKDYFPVVRVGISDAAREMRFGFGVWSKEGDTYKRQIVLIDRTFDVQHKSPGLLQPELLNMKVILATVNSTVDELLTLLSNKGVLTQQDLETLKQDSEDRTRVTFRDFYKVTDIDEWLSAEED